MPSTASTGAGRKEHTSLVRHGEDWCRVVFEFEFNEVDYRITRNRPLSGSPTQRVEKRVDGEWKPIALPPAAGRRDPLKLWTESTLGLGFDAFTASVLLRQGQADEIITATGSRRLAVLKKIIGVGRYEELSKSIHDAVRRCNEKRDDLRNKRDGLTPVTDEEIREATDEHARAETDFSNALTAVTEAAGRVPRARHWVALDTEWQRLEGLIRDADARTDAEAGRIRDDFAPAE